MRDTRFTSVLAAKSLGVVGCSTCGLVSRLTRADSVCRRCHTRLHARKPDSLSRSWAFLLAAAILYVPANVYAIVESRTVAGAEHDTILHGVALLWRGHAWLLAGLVFFASIVVPLVKLFAMTLLLVSVHLQSTWGVHERAVLFRLLEFVGRWSMLDVYVVAILVALVRLRSLATMEPGPGAIAFAAVVVLSMLAAQSFDPRLLWDSAGQNGRD